MSKEPVSDGTFAGTNVYIQEKIQVVEAKANELVSAGQGSRAGAFVGALGLGASALARLHKDAAVGFATLGALSVQGVSLSAPSLWVTYCDEAVVALTCLLRISGPLAGKYQALQQSVDDSASYVTEFALLEAEAREVKVDPILVAAAAAKLEALRLAAARGGALLRSEGEVASSLHTDASEVIRKLNGAMWRSWAAPGTFKLAAADIVSKANVAAQNVTPSTTTAAKGLGQAGIHGMDQGKPTLRNVGVVTEEVRGFTLRAGFAEDGLAKLLAAIGEQPVQAAKVEACKDKLVGAFLPLTFKPEPPAEGFVLGQGKDARITVSGGTGSHFGTWLGVNPPSDLIAAYPNAIVPGETVFIFKQLKKETAKEASYEFLIFDGTNAPQKREIKIKVPKE